MHLLRILNILGLLLLLFSATLLPPMAVSVLYDDGALEPFVTTLLFTLPGGLAFWGATRTARAELSHRDGFIVVVVCWLAFGLLGALPFIFGPHLAFTDSVFEAISGLTTTGATVLTHIDDLPPGVLFYRQQIQWLGGMGMIVLAVALLPMLGVGGMQLYRAETPGPAKDTKLLPRITQTAKVLWYLYVGLTIACAVGYWLGGMSVFDAICHSFTTLSTGGFSTHDQSMGYFDSPAIELVATVFMVLGSLNFAVHFVVWHDRDPRQYLRDVEARAFLAIAVVLILAVSTTLYLTGQYPDISNAVRYGTFQLISIISSTGFTTTDFSVWPVFLPGLLMTISFIGGCAGSTAGGLKVIRVLLLVKQVGREFRQLVHPQAVIPVKVGGRCVAPRLVDAVWGFFTFYVLSFGAIAIAVAATGIDYVTAFSAVAACINDLGPGLGEVASNFAALNPTAKWLLAFAMLLGRLELFTLIVLLSPAFWRR